MHFQIGDNFISDRHLKLAGRLWLCRRDYRKTGFLDDNRPDSPVAQHFQSSLELLRSGAVDIAELEIFNLAAKYYELADIGKYDSQLLKRYKRRLRSQRLDDYLGVQCEIAVASALLLRRFQFICPDPPDFEIRVEGAAQLAHMECTSVHITQDSGKELLYKVGSAINAKQAKGYCDRSTALVIDVTNVMHLSHKNGWNLNPGAIIETYSGAAANSGFGAVLILSEIANLEKERVETVYLRLAAHNPSIELERILDKCFPDGQYPVTRALLPRIS